MSLYKYMPRKFALGLVHHGLLRIGTLHDYRRQEHGQGISDGDEGTKAIEVAIERQHFASGKDVPKTLAPLGIISVDDFCSNITLENIFVRKTFATQNCYLWCASSVRSRNVMEQFEGADTCIEIVGIAGFFASLRQTMTSFDSEFQGLADVRYQSRMEDWNTEHLGYHPAIIKGPEYSSQHEVRAIWTPTMDCEIGPIILHDESLAQYCELREI